MAKKIKHTAFIDRHTDAKKFTKALLSKMEEDIERYIQDRVEYLKSKEEGSFETVSNIFKSENKEIANMQAFYRCAVVPYYYRQSREYWEDEIPREELEMASDEIKREIGFILYDVEGLPLMEKDDEAKTNSTSSLENTKDFSNFLIATEEVCFGDQYIFPDSEQFKELAQKKGRKSAEREFRERLKTKISNMYD